MEDLNVLVHELITPPPPPLLVDVPFANKRAIVLSGLENTLFSKQIRVTEKIEWLLLQNSHRFAH